MDKGEHHYANLDVIQRSIRQQSSGSDDSRPSRSISEEISTSNFDLGYVSQTEPQVAPRTKIEDMQEAIGRTVVLSKADDSSETLGRNELPISSASRNCPTPSPRSVLSLKRTQVTQETPISEPNSSTGKISKLVQKYKEECDKSTRYLTYKKDETFSCFLKKHLSHFQTLETEDAKRSLEIRQSKPILVHTSKSRTNGLAMTNHVTESNKEIPSPERIDNPVDCEVNEICAKVGEDSNGISDTEGDSKSSDDRDERLSGYVSDEVDNDDEHVNDQEDGTIKINGPDVTNVISCPGNEKTPVAVFDVCNSGEHFTTDRNGEDIIDKSEQSSVIHTSGCDSTLRSMPCIFSDENSSCSPRQELTLEAKIDATDEKEVGPHDIRNTGLGNFVLKSEDGINNSLSYLSVNSTEAQMNSSDFSSLTPDHSRSSSNSSLSVTNEHYKDQNDNARSFYLKREPKTSSVRTLKELQLDRRIPMFRKKVSKFLPQNIHARTSSESSVESFKPEEKVITSFRQIASEAERSIGNELTTFKVKGNDLPHSKSTNSLSLVDLYRKSECEKRATCTEVSSLVFVDPTESDNHQGEPKSESGPSSQLSSESGDLKCKTCLNSEDVGNCSDHTSQDDSACFYFLKETTHDASILNEAKLCHEAACPGNAHQSLDNSRSCETLNCRQFKRKHTGGVCAYANYKPCSKTCFEKRINRRQRKNFESIVEPQLFEIQHILKTESPSRVDETSSDVTFSTFKPREESVPPADEHIYMNVKVPQNEKFLTSVVPAKGDVFDETLLNKSSRKKPEIEDKEQSCVGNNTSQSPNISNTFLKKLSHSIECSQCGKGSQPGRSCGEPKTWRKSVGCRFQPHKLTQLCVAELLKHDVSTMPFVS